MTRNTIEIQVLADPAAYTLAQVKLACCRASVMRSGLFVLVEPPEKCERCYDQPETFCVACGAVSEG